MRLFSNNTQFEDHNLQPFYGITCGDGQHVVSGGCFTDSEGKEPVHISLTTVVRDLEDGKQIPKAGQYHITEDKVKGSPSTQFQLASSLAINALTH